MTGFVVAAVALVSMGVAFAVWSMLRAPRAPVADRRSLNVALYRQRLDELDREVQAGRLDAAARATLADELGAELLAQVESAPESEARPMSTEGSTRRERWLALGLAVVLPLAAGALYLRLGAHEDVVLADALAVLREAAGTNDLRAIDRLVTLLEQRATERPDDPETRYLLGHARMHQGEYDAAAAAFARLAPAGDLPVLVSLAQARYLASGGRITPETQAVIDRALRVNPHESVLREMLAIDALGRGDYGVAASHLEQALAGGGESPRAAELRARLVQVQSMTDEGSNRPAIASSSAEAPGAGAADASEVEVRVAVLLGAIPEPGPGARVFVIAREIDGPPMPIAVRALAVDELPAEVRLTDADAMQPSRTLSQFDRVEVVARLSRSGNAMRQSDDVEARSGPVEPRARPRITLTIGSDA